MKPVMQTRFGEEGNCGQACIASILELPLEEVVDFRAVIAGGKHWQFALRDFLLPHGLMPIIYYQESEAYTDIRPKGYHIAGGPSPREHPDGHYVVCLDGMMAHDPHPDGAGLLKIDDWILLIPVVTEDDNQCVDCGATLMAQVLKRQGEIAVQLCHHCGAEQPLDKQDSGLRGVSYPVVRRISPRKGDER